MLIENKSNLRYRFKQLLIYRLILNVWTKKMNTFFVSFKDLYLAIGQ
jgi:hypothetical protein